MAKTPPPATDELDAAGAQSVEPVWYKDAVIYQLHVRSFRDSTADGIGDFAGLTQKLDYLQDLGVTALWLLPFYPSPLRDDGYDISSYTEVNPAYGDLRDFKNFVREAHARGLRVITELVINHTSDQHPWFQRARRAPPGSVERDYYVWSDTPEKYADARIIFKDFEVSNWAWDPVAKAYYWHRFYAHQPDLNFENPRVHKALFDVLDYWLKLGVDGLRLDAVPYLYEREGSNCENLPETHAFLKKLRAHVDRSFPGRMLLAEANQWPEDAIAYFGDGDECHTAFHFPVMPRLFMGIHMEDRFPIVDILQQTPPIPADCQWLIFLRNHDELTLEMVTDEERDYMYRVYARDSQARINLGIRRRLAPLLGNNRRKIELMNGLLCSLPGTPVLYYGDEIGMGDNIYLGDRNGVRTPMQWSPDRNAGFSDANPQRLYSPVIIDSEYLFEAVNVETQQKNPSSLLWWMKRLIALRQHHIALRRGGLEILAPDNSKILAFIREHEEERVLVVANLSRFVQFVELDLSRFAGGRLTEMFGQTVLPAIGKSPYVLTLAPHAFYWFALDMAADTGTHVAASELALIKTDATCNWRSLALGRQKRSLEAALRKAVPEGAWFQGKGKPVQAVHIVEAVSLDRAEDKGRACLLLLRVDYLEGEPESYLLPLVWLTSTEGEASALAGPAVARTQQPGSNEPGLLLDAGADAEIAATLLELIAERRRLKGLHGHLAGLSSPELAGIRETSSPWRGVPTRVDLRDNYVVFGDRLVLKLFRRLQSGIHPAVEIGRFLTRPDIAFAQAPRFLGSLEYRGASDEPITIGVLHEYVPNTVLAWQFAQDALLRFCEQVMAQPVQARPGADALARGSLWDLAAGTAPPLAQELLGGDLEWATLLGRRTGELHLALSSRPADPAFAPEPYSQLHQRSLYQSARKLVLQTFHRLRGRRASLPPPVEELANSVLSCERQVLDRLRSIVGPKIIATRIRCHGHFHLDQVLYTGKDFLFADMGGEPRLPLSARRIKQSPIDDLAGMVHSFQYAASQMLAQLPKLGITGAETVGAWQHAARFWSLWSGSAFLRSYAVTTADSRLLPPSRSQWDLLLDFNLLEEAVSELRNNLADATDQVAVSLERIGELIEPMR
jgi:maltose alpha-D-glucosyltransferase/alpha-amylase